MVLSLKKWILLGLTIFFGTGLYYHYRNSPAAVTASAVYSTSIADLDATLVLCRYGNDDYSYLVLRHRPAADSQAHPHLPNADKSSFLPEFGEIRRFSDGCGLFAPGVKPILLSPRGNNLIILDAQKVYTVYLPENCPVSVCYDPAAPNNFAREILRTRILATIQKQPQFADWGTE